MSYDLECFAIVPRESAEQTRSRIFALDENGEPRDPGPINPERESRKQQLVNALREHDANLTPFAINYAEIAKFDGISEAEAGRKYRHIELNEPEDAEEPAGIQITIDDEHVSVTVPYWHQGQRARDVVSRIAKYLQVIEKITGYRTFDPQLNQLLDVDADMDRVLAAYEPVVRKLAAIAEAKQSQERSNTTKRPWWRFW